MRPVCQRNTHSRSSSGTGVSTPPLKPKTGSIVLFVPFIHYETLDRYRKMEATVAQVRRNGRPVSATPDAQLIQGYLESDRPLHVRRDLDKYHNDRVDTTARAADQVTARSDRKQHTILMLDQLWLWVIGKDMVVSCFAERWEQPSTDPLNVRDSILDALKGEQNITSNYHLATLILTHSYNILDSIRVSQTHKFMNLFESSIKTVVDRQDRLLANFYQISHRSSNWLRSNRKHHGIPTRMDQDGDHDYVLDALLDLSEETTILSEVNDIRDEINIVEDVVSTQKSILQEFEALVTEELQDREEEDIGAVMTQLKMRWRALGRRIDTRQRDLNRMSRRAENSHSSLRSLLELKQMQSNALEAKFARNQAVTTSKQGQAVLVFTIVTIIFLPMSFIATLFTVELSEWPNPLTLSYMAKYTFGIGLGISIPLVVIAMTVSDVVATVKAFFLGDHRLFRALRG
ncbi:hypothetical protein GGS20DRAFT_335400 [Poronia punctata]|nr:hypothetical protein GGS20DRAFT_335400 [Poronia punctata]